MRARSRAILRGVAEAVAWVSGLYCVVLAVLLGTDALRLAQADVVESTVMDRLVERMAERPQDQDLREEIRAFDLVARRAYFDTRDRLRAGSLLLFAGLAALVASLRLEAYLGARIPEPDSAPGAASRRNAARRARTGIAAGGAVIGLLSLGISGLLAYRDTAAASRAAQAATVTIADDPEDWPAFRGQGGRGVAPSGEAAPPPVSWDVPSGRGVLWRADVPLPGFNSPIVWQGSVYLTGSDGERREIYAYEAAGGGLRWIKEAPAVPGSPDTVPEVSEDTGHAAPSMTTDGERLFALFSNGDLLALDAQGEVLWSRALGIADSVYGFASSLVASSSLLYVQFDESGGGRLYALETATGNTAWVVERGNEAAWSSPVLVATSAGARLVLNGNPSVACYDAATGRELWSVDCMAGDVAPSPAYADGVAYAAASLAPLSAFAIDDGRILWQADEVVPDVSSPVASGGLLFSATSYGSVSCRDAASGALRWSQDFDEGFYASPIVVGEVVYLTDRRGRTRVFQAAAEYRELSLSVLGEPSDCTPAFSAGRVYLRSISSLVCVGGEG